MISSFSFSNAQEIGIRVGNFQGGIVAIDGIFSTGEFNRVHADVAFFVGGVGIDVLWDFLYRPLGEENFYWYVGAGPYTKIANDFDLGVKGEVGLEYLFSDVPIAVGCDWRPGLEIINETGFRPQGFGFNARWVFGKE